MRVPIPALGAALLLVAFVPAVLAYNWGWRRFHPDTATWSAEH